MINIFFMGVSFKNRYRYCNIIQTINAVSLKSTNLAAIGTMNRQSCNIESGTCPPQSQAFTDPGTTRHGMTTQRFQLITPGDLPDYEDQADEIAFASWPEFMLNDDVANRNWHELFDRFGDYQFAMLDPESNRMAAMANSVPFYWDQPLEDLPEGGWDWVFLKAIEDHKNGAAPNIQSAIQIAIHPNYQSQGVSSLMVKAMAAIGRSKGFKHLVAPVRPNQKSIYPLISMDDYIRWQTDEGLPFDAWLRVHVRVGGRIIKPCHEAMTIRGSRAEWESWTGMKFPQSGEYVIPGGLNPMGMDVENDTGLYIEPNVWMVHRL
jgi:GNAT superfamily N-acetyltransferase